MRILLTGGAGFIGSALVRWLLESTGHQVCNIDKLTYASDLEVGALQHPRYQFQKLDICDLEGLTQVFASFKPNAVMHLAAESHVDRSIEKPSEFLMTNVFGTFAMLQAALSYWKSLDEESGRTFRFHHVSTDEVFGDLAADDPAFTELTPYQPSSPYSASKAASDHLVRAWHRTYGLPVVLSNCSNNYGPRQFPEKLIPLMILNAIKGRPLPVYGDGMQVRDWLYVGDHVSALYEVLTRGRLGETYNIGGSSEQRNKEVVTAICDILEEEMPQKPSGVDRYSDLIVAVEDRPGHDRRYAIDSGKIQRELGWRPQQSFHSGLRHTVQWYVNNTRWCEDIQASRYDGRRMGLTNVDHRGGE